MANQTPDLYALLIGIDYYIPGQLPDGTAYKSLGGCVRDINRVEDYLQRTLKPKQIFKLVSVDPATQEAAQPQDLLPTYENIVAKFGELTEIAKKDDQVYIHYSGHGGRAQTIYPELKGDGQSDEGLVPMDISNPNSRYLRDLEIATLLKKMVEKGLVVTVIFDCCHSGGTTRGDSEIRGLDGKPDTTSRPQESLVASHEELVKNWLELTGGASRSANTDAWLPESRDYVLLAACRPSEYAYEYAFNGKERNGAVTYWLLDTLANQNSELTYKLLYDRIYAKVQSQFQTQTPMLFGEGNRLVFSSNYGESRYTVGVIQVDTAKNRVQLNAGKAHGMGKGARFAIYPPGTKDFTEQNTQIAIAEVTAEINVTDAWAAIEPDSLQPGVTIEQASVAVMLSAPIDLVRRVRLFEKQEDRGTNELPPDQVLPPRIFQIQNQALEAIKGAIASVGKGWVELVPDDEAEHYQVAVNKDGEYEICDPNGTPIPNLRPALKVNEADAAEGVVKRLVHLTKYRAAQELDNPSALTNKLIVQLTDQDKKPLTDPTNQTLSTGDTTHLYIKNESNQELNITVLDLQSDWGITQLDIFGDGTDFANFSPGQEELIPLNFSLPEGYEEGKDILKVFATLKGTSFRWLELPSLDQPISRAADRGLRSGSASNPLEELLEAMGSDIDSPPPTRAAQVASSNRGWATKVVTVSVKAI